jgi:hypothetical protein
LLTPRLCGSKLNEFLENSSISILLKLIFIFKHESKEDIKTHLATLENYYASVGMLEGLIITGGSKLSVNLIKNYLNKSDDLLVSVILSKFFLEGDRFSKACESDLYETLNRLKMFNERILLSQKLNEITSHMEKKATSDKKPQFEWILSCFYCGIKIHSDKADQFKYMFLNNKDGNEFIDFCPKCIKKLPSCAICLCPIEINIQNIKHKRVYDLSGVEVKREHKVSFDEDNKNPDRKYIWCTKCRHGGHIEHLNEWFSELMICPVADCNCICLEYNHILI